MERNYFSFVIGISLVLLFTSSFTKAQSPKNALVIAENANLRETPSTLGLAEGEVPQGTKVKVLDEKLPWYIVRVGDRVGWMHGATIQFLSDTNESGSQTQPIRVDSVSNTTKIPEREQRSVPTQMSEGYIRGPRGGCYYISGSGRKVYVDRSMCN